MNSFSSYRWIYWHIFFLILLVRGDGYFPIPKSIDPSIFRIVVLFQTIILVVSFGFIIKAVITNYGEPPDRQKKWHLGMLIAISYFLIFGLHILQQRRFQELGYSGNIMVLSVIFAFSILVLKIIWNKSKFWAVMCSSTIIKLYPLIYFPITAGRSDMLPIIQKAGESIISGNNIYQYYFLENQTWTQMVRFPGLILSFTPAVFFQIDLRFVLILSEFLFFYLVYRKWSGNPFIIPGLLLLAFFPYWHYRHELYETPFWIVLLLTFFAFRQKNLLLHLLSLSILLSFHQWGILFAPFLLLYLARQKTIFYSLKVFILSLPIAFAAIFFTSRGDIHSFLHHTFFYYGQVLRNFVESNSFHPNCLYFTSELGKVLGYSGINIFRIGSQITLFLLAVFIMKKSYQLMLFLACSLFAMLLTNTVAWTYQYLLVGILLWLAILEKEKEAKLI